MARVPAIDVDVRPHVTVTPMVTLPLDLDRHIRLTKLSPNIAIEGPAVAYVVDRDQIVHVITSESRWLHVEAVDG